MWKERTKSYRRQSLITLCAYAQQGYAFGSVGLCMYVCMYDTYIKKIDLFSALLFEKLLLCIILLDLGI